MLYRIIRAIPSSYHTMENEDTLNFRLQKQSTDTFDPELHDVEDVGPGATIWDTVGLFKTREAAIGAIIGLSTPPEYFDSENPNVPIDVTDAFPTAA